METSPVYAAAKTGQLKKLQQLLEDGESTQTIFGAGWTPLHAAAYYGRTEAVRILLANGATVEAPLTESEARPLHKACERGFVDIISLLLAHGADIEAGTKEGFTPLYIAARDDRIEAVRFLLETGADATARSHEGYTPLYIAAGKGNEDIVRHLVETGLIGLNTESDKGWTPLLFAARNGHEATVKYLLEKGANGNTHNNEGWWPLHVSAYNAHLKVVELLLGVKKGGLEGEILASGNRPLHKAVERGHLDVIRLLIDARAKINAQDIAGRTPLFTAVEHRQLAATIVLLERGADVNKPNYKTYGSKTPLQVAVRNDSHSLVSLLLRFGADMHCADEKGKSALDYASESKKRELKNGKTVLDLLLAPKNPVYEESLTLRVGGETMATTSASSSDSWFQSLDRLRKLLRAPAGQVLEPVKVAIIDSGVDPIHPHRNLIHDYQNFVDDSVDRQDGTGHGSTGVDLVCKVMQEPAIFVARVFERSSGSIDVQDRIAEAIEYARTVWGVDIIALASGFNQPHERMEQEIRKACNQGILIFAAASNDGNSNFITFPANLTSEVICMFATDANAKAITSSINPSPSRKSPYNFAIFGKEVVSRPRAKAQSGTSMSTFLGAATAGLMLEFSRQEDATEIIGIQRARYLKSVHGMSAVFERMTEGGHEGYHCMTPWKIRSVFQESPDREKRFIANVISAALDKSMV